MCVSVIEEIFLGLIVVDILNMFGFGMLGYMLFVVFYMSVYKFGLGYVFGI